MIQIAAGDNPTYFYYYKNTNINKEFTTTSLPSGEMEYDPLFMSESEMDADSRDGAPDPSLPHSSLAGHNIWSYRTLGGPEEALGWPPLAEPLPLYYEAREQPPQHGHSHHHHRGPRYRQGLSPGTGGNGALNIQTDSFEARRKR